MNVIPSLCSRTGLSPDLSGRRIRRAVTRCFTPSTLSTMLKTGSLRTDSFSITAPQTDCDRPLVKKRETGDFFPDFKILMNGAFLRCKWPSPRKRGKIIDEAKFFDRGFLGGKAVRSCKCRGYVPYKILIKNLLIFCKNLLDENIVNLV